MSPSEPMDPLERRYRRLLRLLPADHRAARGEELLGLLLDLDAGRTRPSPRQAVGVVGLALRLRLPGAATLLLTAFLVASGTEIAGTAHRIGTGATTVVLDDRYPIQDVTLALLVPALLRLAVAVAWILGARRATLLACAALLAWSLAVGGLLRLDVVVFVGLGAAAALRWWPPRHRRTALLAAIPLAMLAWTLAAASGTDLGLGLLAVTAVVALVGAVGGGRPDGSGDRPTPAPG
jgi:hypothetical protein